MLSVLKYFYNFFLLFSEKNYFTDVEYEDLRKITELLMLPMRSRKI